MKTKFFLLFFFILIFSVSLISSVENIGTFEQDECVQIIQTCDNCSYVNITQILYPNSTSALADVQMSQTGTYFYYQFCNTSLNGFYIVTGTGDPDGDVDIWNYEFTITPNGETANVGKAVFYIGLLSVLLFFLTLCVLAFVNYDNLLTRVGMIGLGYLFLISISFIGWNMASDFLTSAPFLIEMLRIIFFVLISGLFPLAIGGFAWYIIMLFKIKEIERLMTKGLSWDEAERRTKRRRK